MPLSDDQQSALIEAVRSVARAEIMPRFRNLDPEQVLVKSRADDLVTVADQASEIALTAAARTILPVAEVVGEEAVADDPRVLDLVGQADQVVVIDPIDGTWNFANGLPLFGVILAVVENGETVFGLLYDPVMDDWVRAAKGQGAWFERPDRKAVRLSTAEAREEVGYVQLGLFPVETRRRLALPMAEFQRFTPLRCSCHEYRMLARAKAGFGLTGMMNVWDHAAGILALEEAGGAACLADGSPYSPTMRGMGGLLTAKSPEYLAKLQSKLGPLI